MFSGNADDSSGLGKNGKVNNAVLSTNRFGKVNSAYKFDGDGDVRQMTNVNDLKIGLHA